jgi:hypothetical protein
METRVQPRYHFDDDDEPTNEIAVPSPDKRRS